MKNITLKTSFVLVVAILILTSVLTACSPQKPASSTGGVLNIGHNINPNSLDPVRSTFAADIFVHAQIYDSLLRFDSEGNIVPWLCTSWEFEDDTTLTLNLRKGVTFHDGTDFNAGAVKQQFDRLKKPEMASLMTRMIQEFESIEVIDDYTLAIKTKRPMPYLLNLLAGRIGRINSPAAIEKWGDDYGIKAATGTGPFKLVKWVQDTEIVLEKNKDYWAKDENGKQLPYLDGLVFKLIPDPATMYSNLITQGVDIAGILPVDFQRAQQQADLKMVSGPIALSYGTFVDCTRPPFDNIKVRQAVAYATDKDELLQAVAYGSGVKIGHFVPPGLFGYDPTITGYTYDPEKAKKLLSEAGYDEKNPLRFTATEVKLTGFDIEAEVLQSQLARVGIEMKLDVVDSNVMIGRLMTHNYNVIVFGTAFTSIPLDPQGTMDIFYGAKGFWNAGRIVDAELDAMIQKAGVTMDKDSRKVILHDIQQYMIDKAYDWWYFGLTGAMGMQQYVMGYTHSITGDPMLERVWLDK